MGILSRASLLVLAFATTWSWADPPLPTHYFWRNTAHNSHYVLYDFSTRKYVETIDCKARYNFTVKSTALNTLTLYDASRDMTVQLNYDSMSLKARGATAFTFYQRGTFDDRIQFKHNVNGTFTGALSKQAGCQWVEYLAGSKTPNWRFKEVARTATSVDLYDASRDMTVRLTADAMYLRTGSAPLAFFKKGNW